jgi:hypothetical protein
VVNVKAPLSTGAKLSLDAIRSTTESIEAAQADQDHWVRRARELGAPWEDIGAALGITKQSAWSRYHQDGETEE